MIAFKKNPDFGKWKNRPFLALSMYLELRIAFGWQAFIDLIRQYIEVPKNELPQNDNQIRDQKLTRFSKIVQRNLSPFFTKWAYPISKEAISSIQNLPSWDPSLIVDCSKKWGPKAPCAQMTLSSRRYGEKSTYTLIINTWAILSLKRKESLILTFKGDVPTHPKGNTKDNSFPIILQSDSPSNFSPTAIYNAVSYTHLTLPTNRKYSIVV